MSDTLVVTGSLVTAVAYALATFFIRRGMLRGAGLASQLVSVGIGITLVSIPVVIVTGFPRGFVPWPGIFAGIMFGLGQLLVAVSISSGDASIQTPLMGVKPIWVALLSWALFGIGLATRLWIAATLSIVAVFLIGFTNAARRHVVRRSLVSAIAATVSYAVTDAMLGSGRYGGSDSPFFATLVLASGISVVIVGLLVAAFGRFAPAPATRKRWLRDLRFPRALVLGSAILSVQFLAFVAIIASSGEAAKVNILYTSRGLWSVLLVWIFSHGDLEAKPPGTVLLQRGAGAVVLIVALILAV